MVKISDIEISSSQMIGRVIVGSIAAMVTLVLLVVIPAIFMSLSGPAFIIKSVNSVIWQVLNPIIMVIGVIVSILVLSSLILRKSRLEGPTLIGLGAATFLYFFLLVGGGMTRINIAPQSLDLSQITSLPIKVNASISVNSVTLLILLSIISLTLIVKGILLIRQNKDQTPNLNHSLI